MSLLSPHLINERDRRYEVACLLALSILRHKIRLNRQSKQKQPSNSLDLQVFPNIHGIEDNKK